MACVACIHVAYLAGRRCKKPPVYGRLFLLGIALPGFCCIAIDRRSDSAPMHYWLFVICGLYLAVRIESPFLAIPTFIVFLIAGGMVDGRIDEMVGTHRYTDGKVYWDFDAGAKLTPTEAVDQINKSVVNKDRMQAGYLDEHPSYDGAPQSPFVMVEPIPEPYSWMTGLYGRRQRYYHLNIPPIPHVMDRLSLVETDADGKNPRPPIPVNTFDNVESRMARSLD